MLEITLAEADRYAVTGEPVAMRYGGFDVNPTEIVGGAEAEYGLRTIRTFGTGNNGITYLKGKTPRARKLVRKGKIRTLLDAGHTLEVAAIAVETIHGMEPAVLRVAEDLITLFKMVPSRALAALAARSHAGVNEATDGFTCVPRMSWSRKYSAALIAARVAGVCPRELY